MPEYLDPGAYIEEIPGSLKPIEGVPTSTAAFIGEAERGPTMPRMLTSYKDYERWFGGVTAIDKYLPHAVNGFFENGGKRVFVCRITDNAATPAQVSLPQNFLVRAIGPGAWGKRVYVYVSESSTKLPGPNGALSPVGFRLQFAYYASAPTHDPTEWFKDSTKPPFPSYAENFDDLVGNSMLPDFYEKRLLDSSALAMLVAVNAPAGTIPQKTAAALPLAADGAEGGVPDSADYVGSVLMPQRPEPQGLAALQLVAYRDVSLVYAPGASFDVAKELITHCENSKYRFAVVDCQETMDPSAFEPRSVVADSKHAAFYYPWIYIADPQTGAQILVPPGGHILGVYARTDAERGVFKAPANETLHGALQLSAEIDDIMQDQLNPRGINAIRRFPGRGIRVWGARTLSSDGLWRYVSVRRLFIFLERSIYEGTQWAVFEPNDDRLWARVIESIRLFLRTQWRLGALFGRTEEEAFFIRCDRTTMTQGDILNRRLICEIGIAPVRPAEFVVFRILQDTGNL